MSTLGTIDMNKPNNISIKNLDTFNVNYYLADLLGLDPLSDADKSSCWIKTSENWDYIIFNPSDKWNQGGPLMEKYKIASMYYGDMGENKDIWYSKITDNETSEEIEAYDVGLTRSAMRCLLIYLNGQEEIQEIEISCGDQQKLIC